MFKVLYRCNPTIERHTNSPLADSTRLCLVSSIKGNVKKNTPPLAGCFLAFQPA
jgi:hypothetical protein